MRNGNLLDLANTSDYSLRFSYSYWELKKEQLTIIVYSSPINDYQKVNSVVAYATVIITLLTNTINI